MQKSDKVCWVITVSYRHSANEIGRNRVIELLFSLFKSSFGLPKRADLTPDQAEDDDFEGDDHGYPASMARKLPLGG